MKIRLSPQFLELVGYILGDGNILYNYKNKFNRLELVGDITQDISYFKRMANLIFSLTKKRPKIKIRKHKLGYGLNLIFNNKQFVHFLVNGLNLPYGNKCFTVKIPERFLSWRSSRHILRGLFEADGSLYFSKSKNTLIYPSYPRIEIRTVSQSLAFQIFFILRKRGFRVQILKTKYSDYKTYLSGELMLEKWIAEIGFSNSSTISKYQFWKKNGYYIPYLTAFERDKLLKEVL